MTITVEEGQEVKKGEQLGYFSYGGSSLALVFQRGAIRRFTKKVGDAIDVRGQIAVAH